MTFFKLMINTVFGKTMENLREQRDIKLASTENYLVLEPNYHTTTFFTEHLIATELKKTQIIMDKSIYLGLSILDISKTKMCDFWKDYLKLKYNERVKLCYMDADSFIVHIVHSYKDIAEDVEKRFNTSYYDVDDADRPLPMGNNKKVIGVELR